MFVFVRRSVVVACDLLTAFSTFAAAPAAANGDTVVVLNSRDATVTLLDQATYKEIGSQPETMAGGFWSQQWLGLKRMVEFSRRQSR